MTNKNQFPALSSGYRRPIIGSALTIALWVCVVHTQSSTQTGTISTYAGPAMEVTGVFWGFSGDGGPATSARLYQPDQVALDSSGNLFIADIQNNRIRKVSAAGIITTVAGSGVDGFVGDGGPATAAALSGPQGVAVDPSGALFVADTGNGRIRKVSTAGIITTVAGSNVSGFAGDGGSATLARLSFPSALAIDSTGNLFIADQGNGRIRKVTAAGIISTVAGGNAFGELGDGGPATAASLLVPDDVAVDGSGNLYIADAYHQRIRKVTAQGIITTLAGSFSASGGDGGPATAAYFYSPSGVAVDAAGNVYIADTGNSRIRKIAPDGIITTVAGIDSDGIGGYAGDGGPAASARLHRPEDVAVDANGNLYISDTYNHRIRKVSFPLQPTSFSIASGGGRSFVTPGTSDTPVVGYAKIEPIAGSTSPSGVAIFGLRQNNILVTEAGVPAAPLTQSGRIYAEVKGSVRTGLAIANPNSQPATISFFFTDADGNFGNGITTIPAGGQTAAFLDQPPYDPGKSFSGTFTFNSAIPVSVIALRGLINERSEFLITTLPVIDLNAPPSTSAVTFPHFADGAGWTTQIVLVNPGDSVLNGTVQFLDSEGLGSMLSVNNQSNTSFSYSIPKRASQTLQTSGSGDSIRSGTVRLIPSATDMAPSGLVIFSLRNSVATVAEAGVAALPAGTAFRLYSEASGAFGVSGSIQTGFAIANTTGEAASVTVELRKLDGSSTGLTGHLALSPNGQRAMFLNQIAEFTSMELPFQGIVRFSSTVPVTLVGLRGRYNERGDFLMTTTPPTNEATPPPTSGLYFPHLADSGGYTTQFILFSANGQAASGMLKLFSPSGGPLNLVLR